MKPAAAEPDLCARHHGPVDGGLVVVIDDLLAWLRFKDNDLESGPRDWAWIAAAIERKLLSDPSETRTP